jgi:hypothetical protein
MPNEIRIVTPVIPPALAGLEKALAREYGKAMKKIGNDGVRTIRRNFSAYGVNASGKTSDSIEPFVSGSGLSLSLTFQATGDRARVMRFIEDGRKPGKYPPTSAIREWMDDVGIEGGSERETDQIAFLISRKIAESGFKGHRIFARSKGEIDRNARTLLADATKKAIASVKK